MADKGLQPVSSPVCISTLPQTPLEAPPIACYIAPHEVSTLLQLIIANIRPATGGDRSVFRLAVSIACLTAIAALASTSANAQQLTHIQTLYDGSIEIASVVAVSPDGAHLYVGGGSSLMVLSHDAETGAMMLLQEHSDGEDGIEGLDHIFSVTVLPDGAYVYATGVLEQVLFVFIRDSATGLLTFVEKVQLGVEDAEGLGLPTDVSVSPDSAHVYVVGRSGYSALAVYSRDSATGTLTFVEDIRNGVDGIDDAGSVTVSPDGSHVYAASFNGDALSVFNRDSATGALSIVEIQRNGVGGAEGLSGASSVTVSPDGAHVYVTGSNDDALAVFSRDSATGALTFVEVVRNGVNGVDGLNGASSVTVPPDGVHVYATAGILNPTRPDDALAVFTRDSATGVLTFVEVHRDFVSGFGIESSVMVSPNGAHVFVGSHYGQTFAMYNRDSATGALTFVEPEIELLNEVAGLRGVEFIAMSPDGDHVYATSGTPSRTIAMFSRDIATGLLTFVDVHALGDPRSMAVSSDGAHVYVPNTNSITVLSRDSATGVLTIVEWVRDGLNGVDGLNGARSLTVSPDGSHVYAVGQHDDALAVFSRDSATGALTFVEAYFDDVNSVGGLGGVTFVTVSPDGAHVYAAGAADDALALFRRDSATGALTFVEAQHDWAAFVTMSPDGDHVYAADDDTLTVYSRNAATGTLTFVQVVQNGVNGIDGLMGVRSVAVSPNGNYAYAAGSSDNALALFRRNHATGVLTFVEVVRDEVNDVDGLSDARSVAVSPDGTHIYVADHDDEAIAVFEHERGATTTDLEDINGDAATDSVDVQLVINAVLGIVIAFDSDVDGNGVVDAADIQLVINGVLGV
jgi:6-phosphogluconolactonase (cycloisomerase 2 family)